MSSPRAADVGGHQHLQAARLELGQRARGAFWLCCRGSPATGCRLSPIARPAGWRRAGAGEDLHLEPVVLAHQVRQQLALARLVDRQHALGDRVGGGVAARDLDQRRLVQQTVASALISSEKVAKTAGSGAARAAASAPREMFVDEAHVEHPVGSSSTRTSTPERSTVRWPAWSSSGPVSPPGWSTPRRRRSICGLMFDAAEHRGRRQLQVLRVRDDAFFDLCGQFARGREDQHADRPRAPGRRGLRGAVVDRRLQDRQGRSRRFLPVPVCAPASRSPPDSTAADRFRLDRGG